MEKAAAIVILAIGVIVSAILIVSALSLTGQGVQLGHQAVSDVNHQISVDATTEKEMASRELTGTEVKYYAREFNDQKLGVMTINLTSSGSTVPTYGIDEMNISNSDGYVKSSDKYSARIERTENGSILGIVFRESGADDMAYDDDTAKNVAKKGLTAIGDNQYLLFKSYQEKAENCRKLVDLFGQYAELTDQLLDAQMDYNDSLVDTETVSDKRGQNYALLTGRYKAYADFYKTLLDNVTEWHKNKWWEPLLPLGSGYYLINETEKPEDENPKDDSDNFYKVGEEDNSIDSGKSADESLEEETFAPIGPGGVDIDPGGYVNDGDEE